MKDYIPFVERVQDIVLKYNKKVMGWDEIANAKLVSNAVAHFWDKEDNALKAIEQEAQILVSPAKRAYMDMQYDSTSKYGLHWAAYIEVNDAYTWDPATYSKGIQMKDIMELRLL